jgi:hypothetical protein
VIKAENMTIDPELCKRIDKNVYGNNPDPKVITKSDAVRAELLNLINEYKPGLTDMIRNKSLFYIYCVADRITKEFGAYDQERGRANMQSAHNQLKNWR